MTALINVLQFEGSNLASLSTNECDISVTKTLFSDKASFSYNDWLNLFKNYHVLYFPGDSAKKQYDGLGENGRSALLDYIRSGGGFLGISSGAYLGSCKMLGLVNIDYSSGSSGSGDLEIIMTSDSSDVFDSYLNESKATIRMQNGPIWRPEVFDSTKDNLNIVANYTGVGSTTLKSGDFFANIPAIVSSNYGEGRVILFSFRPDLDVKNYTMITESLIYLTEEDDKVIEDDVIVAPSKTYMVLIEGSFDTIKDIAIENAKKNVSIFYSEYNDAMHNLIKDLIVKSEFKPRPLTEEEYRASLTYDFLERDSIPQTPTPPEEWFSKSTWGPPATIYPKVIIPKNVDPIMWQQDRIIEVAKKYIGVPYEHKHIPELGMDCSNFTSWVYNYGLGIKFSSAVDRQSEVAGIKLALSEKLEKGDLLFTFNAAKTKISHVMIFIDENTLIDSTVDKIGDGIFVRSFSGWYKSQFAFARRVIL